MVNLKLTSIGAIFGLVLSILFGLIGGIPFGILILRAFLSAIVFGGITAGLTVVYKKYLSEISSEFTNSGNNTQSTGNVVDITIDDDVLPDSDTAPDFYVAPNFNNTNNVPDNRNLGNNFSSLESLKSNNDNNSFSEETRQNSIEKSEQNYEKSSSMRMNDFNSSDNNTFVPKPLGSEQIRTNGNMSKNDSFEDDNLDVLPELDNLVPEKIQPAADIIDDSAFATTGKAPTVNPVADVVVGQDTTLMAEAIRTLLKREG